MTGMESVLVWLKGNQLLCDLKGTSYCVTEREPVIVWLKGNQLLCDWKGTSYCVTKGNQLLCGWKGTSYCVTEREPVIVWLKGNQLLCDCKGTSYCVAERETVIVWLQGKQLLCDCKGTSYCVTERAYTTHSHSYRNSVCKTHSCWLCKCGHFERRKLRMLMHTLNTSSWNSWLLNLYCSWESSVFTIVPPSKTCLLVCDPGKGQTTEPYTPMHTL